jgi:hypothetical protein
MRTGGASAAWGADSEVMPARESATAPPRIAKTVKSLFMEVIDLLPAGGGVQWNPFVNKDSISTVLFRVLYVNIIVKIG